MPKFVTLTIAVNSYVEEDDLEQEHTRTETKAVAVNVDQVRSYYPRTGGKPGTRIVFLNGSAQPVTEPFDQVDALFNDRPYHPRPTQ